MISRLISSLKTEELIVLKNLIMVELSERNVSELLTSEEKDLLWLDKNGEVCGRIPCIESVMNRLKTSVYTAREIVGIFTTHCRKEINLEPSKKITLVEEELEELTIHQTMGLQGSLNCATKVSVRLGCSLDEAMYIIRKFAVENSKDIVKTC